MTKCMIMLFLVMMIMPSSHLFAGGEKASDMGTFILKAEKFIDLLVKDDFSEAVAGFDGAMKEALPPGKLRETWDSLLANVGTFRERLRSRVERSQQFESVIVTCRFENSALDVRIVFNNEGAIAGLFFEPAKPDFSYQPPAYVRSGAFREKELRLGKGSWALPGTLTLPEGGGSFPVVILVHGSGPHDRDETLGPNKPFRDLAWGLASRKIAVFRFEKRTKEYAKSMSSLKDGFTVWEETIDDVLSALSMLRGVGEINPRKIFILGHSLGGTLIPRIGTRAHDVAGYIIMAGASRPIEDIMLEQTAYLARLDGTITETERIRIEELRMKAAKVKDPRLSAQTPPADLPFGLPARYWLDLRGYHPAEAAKSLAQPILVLQGGRDYQVTSADFAGWENALRDKKNAKCTLYPGLNHLFMKGEGKSTPDEYTVSGHIAEEVIRDIADWIQSQGNT